MWRVTKIIVYCKSHRDSRPRRRKRKRTTRRRKRKRGFAPFAIRNDRPTTIATERQPPPQPPTVRAPFAHLYYRYLHRNHDHSKDHEPRRIQRIGGDFQEQACDSRFFGLMVRANELWALGTASGDCVFLTKNNFYLF